MSRTTFQRLFFGTLFGVIDLFIEYSNKKQQPEDVISSKNNQASENQGWDALIDLPTIKNIWKKNDKDVESSKTKGKIIPDDAASNKSYQ